MNAGATSRSGRLRKLFSPESVAVIGASDDPTTFTGASLANLKAHGYPGRVYPVNPRRSEVQGQRCWPSAVDLPETPDTAVIVVPEAIVRNAVSDAIAVGIPSLTIVTAGVDPDATECQDGAILPSIRAMVRAADVAVL